MMKIKNFCGIKKIIFGLMFVFYLISVNAYELNSLAGYDYSMAEEAEPLNLTYIYLTIDGKQIKHDFPEYSHFCIGLWDLYFETQHLEINPETNETINVENECTREDYYTYIDNSMAESLARYLADPTIYEPDPFSDPFVIAPMEAMGVTASDKELIVNKELSVIGITAPLFNFTTIDHDTALNKLDELNIYYYRSDEENLTEPLKLGIMPEASEFSDGETINLLGYTSFALASLKAVNYKLDELINNLNIGSFITPIFEKITIKNQNTTSITTISNNEDNDLVIDASNAGGDVIIRLG